MEILKSIKISTMFIALCVALGCGSTQTKTEDTNVPSYITSLHVEPYGAVGVCVVRFSNIIYEYKEKQFKFPIFQGNLEDVFYTDFKNYCLNTGLVEQRYLGNQFAIKCRRGEIRKTFHEFLNFYKTNILKDVNINKPVIECNSKFCLIWYNFKMNGIPCSLSIEFIGISDNSNYKSVFDIIPDENVVDTSFTYRFHPGGRVH